MKNSGLQPAKTGVALAHKRVQQRLASPPLAEISNQSTVAVEKLPAAIATVG